MIYDDEVQIKMLKDLILDRDKQIYTDTKDLSVDDPIGDILFLEHREQLLTYFEQYRLFFKSSSFGQEKW